MDQGGNGDEVAGAATTARAATSSEGEGTTIGVNFLKDRFGKPWSSDKLSHVINATFVRKLRNTFREIKELQPLTVHKTRALLSILSVPRPLPQDLVEETIQLLDYVVEEESGKDNVLPVVAGVIARLLPEIPKSDSERIQQNLNEHLDDAENEIREVFTVAVEYHRTYGQDETQLDSILTRVPEHLRASTKEILSELSNGNLPKSQQTTDVFQPSHTDLDGEPVENWFTYKPFGQDRKDVPLYGELTIEERNRQQNLIGAFNHLQADMKDACFSTTGRYVCSLRNLGTEDRETIKSFFEGKNTVKDNPLGGTNAPQQEVAFVVDKQHERDPTSGRWKRFCVKLVLRYRDDGTEKHRWNISRVKEKHGDTPYGLMGPSESSSTPSATPK